MLEMTVIFISALVALLMARRAAIKIGLVDKPGVRKNHCGQIPLVGGISIYIALWVLYALQPDWLPGFARYMWCASALLLIGMLDDRFDLPVLPRIILQALVASVMMTSGLCLLSLGNILFGDELWLGKFGYILTLLAVWGAINAFNMIDGLDGLLGVISAVTLTGLVVLFYLGGNAQLAQWSLCLLAAAIPYLLLNLGIPWGKKFKVFMGDAGSTLMGFSVVWLLIVATQGNQAVMRPVTALWLITLPLMDMVAVMIRRVCRGNSPFKPDREHLHHRLLQAGLSPQKTLFIMSGMALILAAMGIVTEQAQVTESTMLSLFILAFVGYFWATSRVGLVAIWLRCSTGQPLDLRANAEHPSSNK